MTQEEIRLACFQVGCSVRGGASSQLGAVALITRWVDGDEFKLKCLNAADGQGITGKGLIDRAESILQFCKVGPAKLPDPPKPKPAPKPAPVVKKKTVFRGGRRTR